MTTYVYALTLNDSETITLHGALTMYVNAEKRNSDIASRLMEKMYQSVEQGSGNFFNDEIEKDAPHFCLKPTCLMINDFSLKIINASCCYFFTCMFS